MPSATDKSPAPAVWASQTGPQAARLSMAVRPNRVVVSALGLLRVQSRWKVTTAKIVQAARIAVAIITSISRRMAGKAIGLAIYATSSPKIEGASQRVTGFGKYSVTRKNGN